MANLEYKISGDPEAPWITLSHSLATDMRMWEAQLPALETHFHVLRYDARGHGGSKLGTGEFSMNNLMQDVLDLWDELDIAQSHFLGLSMGGMTGIGLALSNPERLGRLVACDCRLDAPEFFRDMWDQRIASVEQGGMEAIVDGIIATWLCDQTLTSKNSPESLARQLILATPAESYIACARALKGLDYKQSLKDISVPVLYLVGAQDGVHPDEMKVLSELTPGAHFRELEDAAHLSNLEKPLAFNRATMDFLLEVNSRHGT